MDFGDLVQSIITLLTVAGLVASVMYNQRFLHAQRDAVNVQRQESVANAFLQLNQKLQETLYHLLEEQPQILQLTDIEVLKPYQFKFFQMIDIFADMYQLREMIVQYDRRLWDRTEARVRQLIRKPAMQRLWAKQLQRNPELFAQSFVQEMQLLTPVAGSDPEAAKALR